MVIGYKQRRWQAFISISASGPEFAAVEQLKDRFLRPRMAADLTYTTADVDYLESAFKDPEVDSQIEMTIHRRLRNPTIEEVFACIDEVSAIMARERKHPEWDGGALQISFAGHGRERDGALVLQGQFLTPSLFLRKVDRWARSVSSPGKLRLSLILDACHSGAFLTSVLTQSLSRYTTSLVPYDLFASCMHDEYAWEESSLGHGIFTYCMSARQDTPASLSAKAIQPDNSLGPSLALATGEFGCSLLTTGAQNPVVYWNGAGEVEVCGKTVNVFQTTRSIVSISDLHSRLERHRNGFRNAIGKFGSKMIQFPFGIRDKEMRAAIHQTASGNQ